MKPEFRAFNDSDSIPDLTRLLHRAYGPMADRGLRFLASHQDDAITRERVLGGESFVATIGLRLVGTVTVRRSCDELDWYLRPEVASMEQLAVEPEFQGQGIGTALIKIAEDRAIAWGKTAMALDTSEKANHLVELYAKLGYRIVGEISRAIVNYRSVVMSKTLSPNRG